MIRRLCSTITLIFDADQAGVRASMRSIDLILAEGLNVRVLSLPEGEDPDSFARNHDLDEITAYFEAHQIDFITYKSQILLGEAKDAITKSEAIREIVKSIWHIGDPIKRELYIKQCVDTFNLSEATVYQALADLESKEKRDARSRSQTQVTEGLTVVTQAKPLESRDRQKELERSLIESLLLYGPMREVFDDEFLEPDEKSGELVARRSSVESKVYEKIYLDLQQDEMRFSDPIYSNLFDWVIRFYTEQQGEEITDLLKFLEKQQKEELIEHVSSIVFEYEQYALHQWERKNIYPKERKDQIAQHVSETILSLRSHWVQQHLSELQKRTTEEGDSHVLEEVMDYLMLNQVLSKRLNRVLTV
jgi:DNA primase